ncbi:MAG: ornithine acetyltransferase [Methylophilales bacterium BACL14 MAG-120910-bin43]|jgi:glutamate N-acetyltransferase/amino-acid N-acetyltransferase|nr:MAG: ornithine acetyltransferase [Methylophilales bacterium BACL14 MAG-120910-bin43]MBT5506250.1 bifunctional glutamate N-acetyltransferase/amino-acid acetyltransferase ArgJ [Flammeovirgaceae bacterium]|tara:strand:+ start:12591 stop:13817 length:1227 start_codon:yes stop_codon:yes gene_type:complete
MPVNLTQPNKKNILSIPGIVLGTFEAGIKYSNRKDLTLILLDEGSVVVGVFTKNQFMAAPVKVAKNYLSDGGNKRALLINTGSANAGTGEAGINNAKQTCQALAKRLNISENQVLPFSTGVIMTDLPVGKIVNSLGPLITNLDPNNWLDAAIAIMTTDTIPKAISSSAIIEENEVKVTGISKGSGMINPNMATMLAFIGTDANINEAMLKEMIQEVTDESFNKITVDGDTSTNDSFIIMATNQSKHSEIKEKNQSYKMLKEAILDVASFLSKAIVRDGEGATKFIEINVEQGIDEQECQKVAKSIANSPLVKTAFFASDPNLGRIMAAIGNAPIANIDVSLIDIYLNDILFAQQGFVAPSYSDLIGKEEMRKDEICLKIIMRRGDSNSTVWTSDLSYDYVKINAEYRT